MVCIIFVAGHNDRLEREIASDDSGKYESLKGVPKALLPTASGSSKTILGRWWEEVNKRQQFKEVYLVTNADKYKYYERWATANDFPVENIVNDGTTTFDSRMGSVADLYLVLRNKGIVETDVMTVAGDMLFERGFDVAGVQRFFHEKGGDVAVYYELAADEPASSRGIMEIDPRTSLVTAFHEKPSEGTTESRFASVVFYIFTAATLSLLPTYLADHPSPDLGSFGTLLAWLVAGERAQLSGMKLATAFQLIGQTSLDEYVCSERRARCAVDRIAAAAAE